MATEKSTENRLRRKLANQGYTLHKDRARTWSCDHQGGYMIVEAHYNRIEAGEKFDMFLEDVERFVNE